MSHTFPASSARHRTLIYEGGTREIDVDYGNFTLFLSLKDLGLTAIRILNISKTIERHVDMILSEEIRGQTDEDEKYARTSVSKVDMYECFASYVVKTPPSKAHCGVKF